MILAGVICWIISAWNGKGLLRSREGKLPGSVCIAGVMEGLFLLDANPLASLIFQCILQFFATES